MVVTDNVKISFKHIHCNPANYFPSREIWTLPDLPFAIRVSFAITFTFTAITAFSLISQFASFSSRAMQRRERWDLVRKCQDSSVDSIPKHSSSTWIIDIYIYDHFISKTEYLYVKKVPLTVPIKFFSAQRHSVTCNSRPWSLQQYQCNQE